MKRLTNLSNYNNFQKLYEYFGYELLKDTEINEGLSERIEQAKELASKLSKKVTGKISDAAKNAIENVKKKAGEKWDQIKDIYVSIVSFIDQALLKMKPMIKEIANIVKKNEEEVEMKLATLYVKLGTIKVKDNKIIDIIINFPETTKQILLLNMILLSSNFLSDYGINISEICDVLDALKESKV